MFRCTSAYVHIMELNGKHATGSQRTRREQQSKKGVMQQGRNRGGGAWLVYENARKTTYTPQNAQT